MTDIPTSPSVSTKPRESRMRDILAFLSTALFAVGLLAPMVVVNGKPVVIDGEMKGAVMIQWGLVMGYYFGTSQNSAKKDETINTMAEKQ